MTKEVLTEEELLKRELESIEDEDEDDDLDDLDDLLDEFADDSKSNQKTRGESKSVEQASPVVSTSANALPDVGLGDVPEEMDQIEDEFTKQLEKGLESMLEDLSADPESRLHFEAMMAEINKYSLGDDKVDDCNQGPSTGSVGENKTDPLQDTIAKTMERMKESGEKVDKEIKEGNDEDEFLAAMMKQLGQSASGGESEELGSDDELKKMLTGMMEQLTSKEILYEPMKELDDKYGEWLDNNKSKLSKEERDRYDKQRVIVRAIVTRFENPTYSDSNNADRTFIAEYMQKMQESGSPPPDIMDDMAPNGMDFKDLGIDGVDMGAASNSDCGVQ
ncbi:Pex19 protein family-domain-containing protein [Lipomyces oligophaga]|uniref:Pex19 protein family-domain-containing protein n=1 Tax=Lipomyces oligophaga TaxID=45792 RepID=UPI0034CE374D